MDDVRAILHGLPHRAGERLDWFEAPHCYPLHAQVLAALLPRTYVEIGAYMGYSLIAALEGAASIEAVAWADNQSYIANSNALAQENLTRYLERTGRVVRVTVCDGVETLAAFPVGSSDHAPYFRADVFYVDGDHRYDGALRDMRLAQQLQARVILVDDFTSDCDPVVRQAVWDFAHANHLSVGLVPTFRGMAVLDMASGQGPGPSPVCLRLQQVGVPITVEALPSAE